MPPLHPGEIAILYPRASSRQKDLLRSLPEQIFASTGAGASWKGHTSGDRKSQIQIGTIHAAKGLQYRAVIILWAGISPFPGSSEEQRENERLDRRLLYVGMTRAESFLAITASGQSPYVDDIAASPACQVIRTTQKASAAEVAG